ncbi:MAG: hypothetical protein ACRYG8_44130, partial [Janthinobacterium lividum]
RYWHPTYRNRVTLDCPAQTVLAALASARRFIQRQNSTYRRAKVQRFIPVPTRATQMRLETPR